MSEETNLEMELDRANAGPAFFGKARDRANSANARPQAAKASPPLVRPEMTVAQGFTAIVESCIQHFCLNEALVVQHREATALHQARVSLRRLRAALSIFKPALRGRRFDHLRDELRWLSRQLGDARNLDVYLGQDDVSHSDRRILMRERERAYDRVIAALESRRAGSLLTGIVAWASRGVWRTNEKARRPFPEYGVQRIHRLWRKITRHGELQSLDDDERHELRIEVKKLRYGLDFLQPLRAKAGRKPSRFSKAVKALQEALGSLNDLVTARAIAGQWLPGRGPSHKEVRRREAKSLGRAQRRLDRLRKIGPYWRKSA